MQFRILLALIVSGIIALGIMFEFVKNIFPLLKQTREIGHIKESSDLIAAAAEILEIKPRGMIYFTVYIVKLCYETENETVYSDIIFARKPARSAGQTIAVLCQRNDPTKVMTSDNSESEGLAALIIRHIVSVAIGFILSAAILIFDAED